MVDPGDESDPYRLAEIELSSKKIPFIVRRYLPDGSYEDWKASDLYVEWNNFLINTLIYKAFFWGLYCINYDVTWLYDCSS